MTVKRKGSILSRLVISFLMAIVPPFLCFWMMYLWMSSNIEKYATQMNREATRSAYDEVERVVQTVRSTQLGFTNSFLLSDLSKYDEMDAEGNFNCKQFMSELSAQLNSSGDVIYHLYVYLPRSGVCVSDSCTLSAEQFFLRYYGMNGEESAQWAQRLKQTKFSFQERKDVALVEAEDVHCVEFIQKYPLTRNIPASAVCVVSVRTDTLFSALGRDDLAGEFLVKNGQGDILFQSAEEPAEAFDKENPEMYGVLVRSLGSDWKLYSLIDREKTMAGLARIRNLSMLLLSLYALVCVWLVWKLTKTNYKPLQDLIKFICDSRDIQYKKHTNEFEYLHNVLLNTNMEMRRQQALVNEKFLNMLLRGEVTEKEWKEKSANLSVKLLEDGFLVVCCQILSPDKLFAGDEKYFNGQGKLELGYFIINNIGMEILSGEHATFSVRTNSSVIFIINCDESGRDRAKILGNLAEIKELVNQYFNFGFLTVVSSEQATYLGIYKAYQDALTGLDYRMFYPEDAVIDCAKLETSDKANYYYPLEVEQNLIHSITGGNFEEAQSVIHELFQQNFKFLEKNKAFAQCFMFDFMATMIKAAYKAVPDFSTRDNSEIKDGVNRMLASRDIYEMQRHSTALLTDICNSVDNRSGNDTTDRVMALIQAQYADCQLSIASLAEEVHLHPVYLSSLFKERTGETPSSYIAGFRVEKAKEFMRANPDCSLTEVGQAVGYADVRTFTRVFRKREGVTPTQFKKSLT